MSKGSAMAGGASGRILWVLAGGLLALILIVGLLWAPGRHPSPPPQPDSKQLQPAQPSPPTSSPPAAAIPEGSRESQAPAAMPPAGGSGEEGLPPSSPSPGEGKGEPELTV